MANYPMTMRVLELNEQDRDQIEQIIVKHDLPQSNRIREAIADGFKLGFKQGHDKGSGVINTSRTSQTDYTGCRRAGT